MRLAEQLLLFVSLVMLHVAPGAAKRKCYYDIGILTDISSSIQEPPRGHANVDDLQNFVKGIIEETQSEYEGVDLSLTSFANVVKPEFGWGTDKSTMLAKAGALEVPKEGGDTHMKDAFEYMRDNVISKGASGPAPDMMLFLTDGEPRPAGQNPTQVAKELKQDRVRIFPIGISTRVNETLMNELAYPDRYQPYAGYEELKKEVKKIVERSCEELPPPEKCGYDIGILIDESGTITQTSSGGYENWKNVKRFLSAFLGELFDRYGPEVQVSLNTFYTKRTGHLKTWMTEADEDEIFKLLKPDDYSSSFANPKGGDTHMKDAFKEMGGKVFGVDGDRPDVPNLMLFMTDGKPHPKETQDPREEAEKLKTESKVKIFTLGITADVEPTLMTKVASKYSNGQQAYTHINSYEDLTREVMATIGKTCQLAGAPSSR